MDTSRHLSPVTPVTPVTGTGRSLRARVAAAALLLGALATPWALAQGGAAPGAYGMHGGPAAMRGGHGGPDGGLFGLGLLGHPRMAERALDAIGATADQRTQIATLMAAARADLKAQREAGAPLRQQARELFTQPTVDARAAEALRQQMVSRQDQASRRMMQAMLDISRVLTPAQRQQLATMAEQHRRPMDGARGQPGAAPGPR
jgi:Spy/CpxP family protein refolding chaperone